MIYSAPFEVKLICNAVIPNPVAFFANGGEGSALPPARHHHGPHLSPGLMRAADATPFKIKYVFPIPSLWALSASGLIHAMKEHTRRLNKFFTLGYQSHNIRTLLAVLSHNGVNVLVDVRQNPVSRKSGFSKGYIEQSISRSGIEYLHFPCLGTPPRIRKLYNKTGDAQKALEQYQIHLRTRRNCLRSLVRIATTKHICLMCLEADHNSCHRSVIAQKLTEMTGCQAIHLT